MLVGLSFFQPHIASLIQEDRWDSAHSVKSFHPSIPPFSDTFPGSCRGGNRLSESVQAPLSQFPSETDSLDKQERNVWNDCV